MNEVCKYIWGDSKISGKNKKGKLVAQKQIIITLSTQSVKLNYLVENTSVSTKA